MFRRSNPDWEDIYQSGPDRLWDPPNFLYYGYWVTFLVVKRRGVALTTHPAPRLKKE
jgi:hypothetical protein